MVRRGWLMNDVKELFSLGARFVREAGRAAMEGREPDFSELLARVAALLGPVQDFYVDSEGVRFVLAENRAVAINLVSREVYFLGCES